MLQFEISVKHYKCIYRLSDQIEWLYLNTIFNVKTALNINNKIIFTSFKF